MYMYVYMLDVAKQQVCVLYAILSAHARMSVVCCDVRHTVSSVCVKNNEAWHMM